MTNKVMERKLRSGEALDVRREGEEVAPGRFRLDRFVDGKDYCDAQEERWIWSIGEHLRLRDPLTGHPVILASTGTEFYQHPHYRCLFLR